MSFDIIRMSKFYHQLKIENLEFDIPHCQYDKRCSMPRIDETPFCERCWKEENSLTKFDDTYASKIKIQFADLIYLFSIKNRYTDLTIEVYGNKYQVHRVTLASLSDYFDKMFTWTNGNSIILKDVSNELFEKYLDLIYGKEVIFNNWRDLLQLCLYTKMTLLKWRMDRVIWKLYVPPEEFVDYLKGVEQLYDCAVPIGLISKLNIFYRDVIDLSMFDQNFQTTIKDQNVCGPLTAFNWRYYRNEKYKLFFEIGQITKKKCIGYYTEEQPFDIKELTPEQIKFCDDNDIEM